MFFLRCSTFGRGEKDLNFDGKKRFGIFISVEKNRSIVSLDVTETKGKVVPLERTSKEEGLT